MIGNGVTGLSGPVQPFHFDNAFSKTVGSTAGSVSGLGLTNTNHMLMNNIQRNNNIIPVVYKVAVQ